MKSYFPETFENDKGKMELTNPFLENRINGLFNLVRSQKPDEILKLEISFEEIYTPSLLYAESTLFHAIWYSAREDQRQEILDHFFTQTVLPYFQNSDGQLDPNKKDPQDNSIIHWAVACNQETDVIHQ